jgi:hypothetical protein
VALAFPGMLGGIVNTKLVLISDCNLVFVFSCRADVIPNLQKIGRRFQLQTMVPSPEGSSEGRKNATVRRMDDSKNNNAGCIVLLWSQRSISHQYVLSLLCTGRKSGYGPGSDQDLHGRRSFAQVSYQTCCKVSFQRLFHSGAKVDRVIRIFQFYFNQETIT